MTRLAMIELEVPGTGRGGRVFLHRNKLCEINVDILEQELARLFVEVEDQPRMARIEQLLASGNPVEVAVHPGEASPPEYHAFLKDPTDPNAPLFACVLAPMPIVAELVGAAPHLVFETASFQAMSADTSPSRMVAALEAWARRVWPGLSQPRFDLRPWPVDEIQTEPLPMPLVAAKGSPRGASASLDRSDYPTPEELSA